MSTGSVPNKTSSRMSRPTRGSPRSKSTGALTLSEWSISETNTVGSGLYVNRSNSGASCSSNAPSVVVAVFVVVLLGRSRASACTSASRFLRACTSASRFLRACTSCISA